LNEPAGFLDIANDLAVASKDGDYDGVPGLRVIRI
jgi:hypothetical protein